MLKTLRLIAPLVLPLSAAAASLAYVAEGGAGPRIIILDIEDAEDASETLILDSADRPAWSPDGSRLAFIGNYQNREALYVVDLFNLENTADPSPRVLTLTDGSPVWSPDGRRIAFADNRGDDARLRLIDLDGDAERELSGQAYQIPPWSVAWSPDGSRLAFTRLTDCEDPQIHVINVNSGVVGGVIGGNERRLTDDGWHVVYDWNPAGLLHTRDADIYLLDPDSGETRRLTNSGYFWNPALSPGGESVVFNSTYHLYLLDVAEETVQQLTSRGRNNQPVWSPDGESIAFVSDRDGDREIWIIDADGGNPRQVTDNTTDDHSPTWRPE